MCERRTSHQETMGGYRMCPSPTTRVPVNPKTGGSEVPNINCGQTVGNWWKCKDSAFENTLVGCELTPRTIVQLSPKPTNKWMQIDVVVKILFSALSHCETAEVWRRSNTATMPKVIILWRRMDDWMYNWRIRRKHNVRWYYSFQKQQITVVKCWNNTNDRLINLTTDGNSICFFLYRQKAK